MTDNVKGKWELLAPGGNYEKAVTALRYGADAVYCGGRAFGLRANADNLSFEEMAKLSDFAHACGKKVYITMNILPDTAEIPVMCEYAKEVASAGVDGIIVSDIGTFFALRNAVPDIAIHVSTQSSTVNMQTCMFWAENGATRVNLARELSLEKIKEISDGLNQSPNPLHNNVGLEVFVHGAMCMSYSGRCMLSSYLTGRSSNRGDCAQPCRWKFTINEKDHFEDHDFALSEDSRAGEYYPIEENDRGTFIFNSKDLCMLEYLPAVIKAGGDSFKIEGRMKTDFYVSITVRAYRKALDYIKSKAIVKTLPNGEKTYELPKDFPDTLPKELLDELMAEVESVSHREYSTGFMLGERGSQIYGSSSYIRSSDFVGLVTNYDYETSTVTISQRGNFGVGEQIDFIEPEEIKYFTIDAMTDGEGNPIERAAHAVMDVKIKVPFPIEIGTIVRRKNKN